MACLRAVSFLEAGTSYNVRLAPNSSRDKRVFTKKPVARENLSSEMSKKSCDSRCETLAGRELTKGNSFSAMFLEHSNRTDCSPVNHTGAEQTLIGNLGRPFLTYGRFTLDDPEKSLMRESLIGEF